MTTVMDEPVKTELLLFLIAEETGVMPGLEDELDSLGIDSLEFISLMQAVEERFAVEIKAEDYSLITTVKDIRDRI